MQSPAPPVIAQGVVFALANGEYIRRIRKSRGSVRVEERPKNGTHAVLYALDAATGKQMYSTGDQVALPGSLTGLSIANGRLYFATTDNTMNVFGKYLQTEP
jgi:outer membrane protein assembly factor BamB